MVSGAYLAHLADLVRDGEVDEALVDDACRRVLRMKFRLGLFDGAAAPGTRPTGNEPTDAGRATVRRAGVAAHVLVRNEGVLPLADDASVLLTGGFVHEGEVLLGTWVLDGRGADVVSPAAGLGARLGERLTVDDGRFSDRTLQLARVADVTVALVGEHQSRSGEANSVADLRLPPGQLDLLRSLAGLGKPLVAVVYTGRPLDLTEVLDLADAVARRLAPRRRGGLGARRRAHRGRRPARPAADDLPAVHRAHPDQHPPAADRSAHPGRRGPSRGPVRRRPDLPTAAVRLRPDLRVRRLRTPAGQRRHPGRGRLGDSVGDGHQHRGLRACREVVQAYFRDPVARVTRPLVELFDWAVVDLEPGASAEVSFDVTPRTFAYTGPELTERVDDGEIVLLTGPDAARLQQVSVTLVDQRPLVD